MEQKQDLSAKALSQKVKTIDWTAASREVARFVSGPYRDALQHWGDPLFIERVGQLS